MVQQDRGFNGKLACERDAGEQDFYVAWPLIFFAMR